MMTPAEAKPPDDVDREQQAICGQVAALARNARNDAWRDELVASIMRRRADRPDLLQVDQLPSARGGDGLIARGELLVRPKWLEQPTLQLLAKSYRLKSYPVDGLDGRIERLTNPDLDCRVLDRLARLLHAEGMAASLNYCTPLGPVAKGRGGPEPTTRTVPFPPDVSTTGGVRVGIVDTGITAEIRADRWLDTVERTDNVDPLDAIPAPDGTLDFAAGHGTFAAGVIQQVAPGCDLRVYQALDTDGIGGIVRVACAMVKAVRDDGVQVLNLSLGTQTVDDLPPLALEVALDIIAETEQERGTEVLVVAAAGNDGTARPTWPAAFRRVVAVAGLTADLNPTTWSNRGFWVDISTPAEGVLSTYVEGTESYELDDQPDTFLTNSWALWSGTSFAAPQIAGEVARRVGAGAAPTPRRALVDVLASGTLLPDFGRAVRILGD